jgi:hypothetical protein
MAAGIIVACVPTLGPIIFPQRRFGSSAKKHLVGRSGDTLGSGGHVQLRDYTNDSFDVHSLHSLERDEIALGKSLRYDNPKSHTYVHTSPTQVTNPTHDSPDGNGVRRVIEITTVSRPQGGNSARRTF